jgi:hypothetical protein
MFWSFLRRSLFALFLLCFIPTLTAQSSNLTSPKQAAILSLSEPLWQQLLATTQALPQQMDDFMTSLQAQVLSLQDSNSALQTSNQSLTQQDAILQASLQASQAEEATLRSKLAQLQTDLNASTLSITQAGVDLAAAQKDARALAFGKSLSEYIAFASVGAAGGAVASKGNLVDAGIGAAAGVAMKALLALTHLF